ncbi:MAG: hypothetical protein OEQ47_15705 [Acidimicrobiia bacterium]|nr:hypothetical protein [Acidimicrobiia bacterium]
MTSVSEASGPVEDSTHVACAVLQVEGGDLAGTVEAVRRSVYGVELVAVIGPDAHEDLETFGSIDDMLMALDSGIDAVWIVHSDAMPRPDALGALVTEMDRNHASLVGSKIIDEAGVHLESVGSATDVFGEPYSGLDPDEVDLEQYDVVRDVAAVSGVSTLVRRDLLRGLGGLDPALPPGAAGQDLSQRARLAGSRVMIIPSSEVRHHGACGHGVETWRERAGRYRAMLKVYSLVTLIWLIPLSLVIGLVDGVARIFLRQPRRIVDHTRAVVWNVWKLPTSLRARARVRGIRHVGDEELFRYQLPGSVLLRDLGADIGERFGWVIDAEPGVLSEAELESESSRAVPVVVALTFALLALAARGLLFGRLPASRFSLPPEADWAAVLSSYAGTWNPAGLGSLQPVHPSVAITAAVQGVFGGWPGVTGLITAVSLAAGTVGLGRLLARLGIDGPSRYLAAPVMLAGPFAMAIGEAGDWAGLVAIGAIPWFVDLSIAAWPAGWRGRIGRLGAIFVVAMILASYAPIALLFGAAGVVLVSVFTAGVGTSSLLTMILAVDLGVVALAPYLAGVGTSAFSDTGPSVGLVVGQWTGGALALAVVLTAVGGHLPAVRLAAIGASMVTLTIGTGLFAVGGDISVGAAVLGALGAGVIVAAALAIDLDRSVVGAAVQWVAVGAALFVVGASLTTIGTGRLGLGPDEWTDRLAFVSGLSNDPESVRTLLVGFPDSLPGDARSGNGYAYRLVAGDTLTSAEARLAPPRLGDRALDGVLDVIDRADVLEPGRLLAPFAIQWVMVVDDVEFADRLSAQIDLTEVPLSPGVRVFRNESFVPRLSGPVGVWDAAFAGGTGPEGAGSVRIADNASVRFGPDWTQDEWANRVSAIDGEITYEPVPLSRSLSIAVGSAFVVALLASVALRDRAER